MSNLPMMMTMMMARCLVTAWKYNDNDQYLW